MLVFCAPMKLLDSLSYQILIIASLFLGLAPFTPEPHLWEKLKMLGSGTLREPIDIFDLCMHGAPVVLLLLKFAREMRRDNSE